MGSQLLQVKKTNNRNNVGGTRVHTARTSTNARNVTGKNIFCTKVGTERCVLLR